MLERLAGSDIRKVVKWRSNVAVIGEDPETGAPVYRAFNEVALIDSDQIDDATAAAIAEISQTKDGALRVKMASKDPALAILARARGLRPDPHLHLHQHQNGANGQDKPGSSAREIIQKRLQQIAERSGLQLRYAGSAAGRSREEDLRPRMRTPSTCPWAELFDDQGDGRCGNSADRRNYSICNWTQISSQVLCSPEPSSESGGLHIRCRISNLRARR
jgi:hypothetical protein